MRSTMHVTFSEVIDDLRNLGDTQGSEVARLDPLFATEGAYRTFKERHDQEVVAKGTSVQLLGWDKASQTGSFTQSGTSARKMSRLRRPIPMLAFTPLESTRRRLALFRAEVPDWVKVTR